MGFDARMIGATGRDGAGLRRLFELDKRAVPGGNTGFSFGIEEEYFLADRETMAFAARSPDALFGSAAAATEGRVDREFLECQVEVATPPCERIEDARMELSYIRRVLGAIAADNRLAILSCGTHPTADWAHSVQTDKPHYDRVMDELQMIGRRNMLCGMHVHVELPDPSRRIDVMCRMIPYLPMLLSLSTSSPFWQGRRTGLMGYRLAAYDELPRTGLPELLRTQAEYDSYVGGLVASGVLRDAGAIWWSMRPSIKYPTLELRAPDACTRIDDALAIASLYRSLVRHLFVNRHVNESISAAERALAVENKWRAQRYGVHGSFATMGGAVPVETFLEQVIDMVAPDAEALGCAREVEDCRRIVARGTSADHQIALYEQLCPRDGENEALRAVCQWIARETVRAPSQHP